MAKRKHPTVKSLRQGQTVYLISKSISSFDGPYEVIRWQLHSHKTPRPELGCIIEKMPVGLLRENLHRWGNDAFYSRRRAESECRRRNALNWRVNDGESDAYNRFPWKEIQSKLDELTGQPSCVEVVVSLDDRRPYARACFFVGGTTCKVKACLANEARCKHAEKVIIDAAKKAIAGGFDETE